MATRLAASYARIPARLRLYLRHNLSVLAALQERSPAAHELAGQQPRVHSRKLVYKVSRREGDKAKSCNTRLLVVNNALKLVSKKRSSANQCTVNVWMGEKLELSQENKINCKIKRVGDTWARHERVYGLRRHAAAILDPHSIRCSFIVHLR
jgi:hypothetical protein